MSTMTDKIPPTHRDTERTPSGVNFAGRLLPPVDLSPYDENGELTTGAIESFEVAILLARRQHESSTRSNNIPQEVIDSAVLVNFKQRFDGVTNSIDTFVAKRNGSKGYRNFFVLHKHVDPDIALVFFNEQHDLPSIDVAAAVVSDDSRNITSEILADSMSHFPKAVEIFDAVPEIEFVDQEIEGHFVFSVTKDVYEETSKDILLRRRKTYVASRDWIEREVMTGPEAFVEMFIGANKTPEEIYPVIESIYACRHKKSE